MGAWEAPSGPSRLGQDQRNDRPAVRRPWGGGDQRLARLQVPGPMDNLHQTLVVSKGAIASLTKMGIPYEDMSSEQMFTEQALASPDYEVSAYHALDLIESYQGWLTGEVLYAEAHCIATRLNAWIDMVVAPIPDRFSALIEAVPSYCGNAGGFWINLIFVNGRTSRIIH